MIKNRSDFAAGLLFAAVGLYYGKLSLNLSMGSALQMGPGYFPVVLCGLLICLGVVILVKSFFDPQDDVFGKVPWRALIMLPLAIVVFGAVVTRLGLFPTVFVTAFIASLSSSQIPLKIAAAVSLTLAVFCTLIFAYGINLPIPIFGHWLVN
jgi:hypothetical protein